MKYKVKYACGHTGEVYSKHDADKAEKELCRQCQRDEYLQYCREQNKALGMVDLEGTEKQIAWAETLRFELMEFTDAEVQRCKDTRWLTVRGNKRRAADGEPLHPVYSDEELDEAGKALKLYISGVVSAADIIDYKMNDKKVLQMAADLRKTNEEK